MAWTFCTSGAAISKAGANANSTIVASGATLAFWSNEAEALIKDTARNSMTSNNSICSMIESSWVAQKIIMYDINSYTSRTAETMLDILENDVTRGLDLLKLAEVKLYTGDNS